MTKKYKSHYSKESFLEHVELKYLPSLTENKKKSFTECVSNANEVFSKANELTCVFNIEDSYYKGVYDGVAVMLALAAVVGFSYSGLYANLDNPRVRLKYNVPVLVAGVIGWAISSSSINFISSSAEKHLSNIEAQYEQDLCGCITKTFDLDILSDMCRDV